MFKIFLKVASFLESRLGTHSRDCGIQVGRDPRVPLVLLPVTLVLGTALGSAGFPRGLPHGTPA